MIIVILVLILTVLYSVLNCEFLNTVQEIRRFVENRDQTEGEERSSTPEMDSTGARCFLRQWGRSLRSRGAWLPVVLVALSLLHAVDPVLQDDEADKATPSKSSTSSASATIIDQ